MVSSVVDAEEGQGQGQDEGDLSLVESPGVDASAVVDAAVVGPLTVDDAMTPAAQEGVITGASVWED